MKIVLVIVGLMVGMIAGYSIALVLPNQQAVVPEVIEQVVDTVVDTPADSPLGGSMVEVYPGISVSDTTTTLDLSGRGLTGSLKAEIRLLTGLTVLNLSNNNFTGLPAEVGQLKQLQVLNLSQNQFTGLPYEIGNLDNLVVLDIRGNDYSRTDLAEIKQKLPPSTQVLSE